MCTRSPHHVSFSTAENRGGCAPFLTGVTTCECGSLSGTPRGIAVHAVSLRMTLQARGLWASCRSKNTCRRPIHICMLFLLARQFGITSCFFCRQCAVYGWGWMKELTGRHSCLNFTSRHIVEPGSSEPEKCCKRQFKIHGGRNWSICAVWLCRSCWLANKIENVVFLFFSSIVSFSFWLFVW